MVNKKRHLLEQLLKITKEWDAYHVALESALGMMRMKYKISDEEFEELSQQVGFEFYIDKLMEVYEKYLSEEDLEELLEFYSTKAGKKLGNMQMLNELAKANKNWAMVVDSILMAKGTKASEDSFTKTENLK